MPTVRIDGKPYAVRGRVRRYSQEQFANAFRPEGRLSVQSVTVRQPYVFPNPVRGIGKTRVRDASDPTEFEYCTDSTALTRYRSGVYLPTLSQTATAPSNPANVTLGAMRAMTVQGTTAYGYWSAVYDNAGDTRGRVYEATYSAGSWNNSVTQVFTSNADVDANTQISVVAAASVGASLRLVGFYGRDGLNSTWDFFVYRWGGSSWASVLEVNSALASLTWDQNLNGAQILVDGTTVYLVVYFTNAGAASVIKVYKSTDSGGTFSEVGSNLIGSTNGPTGLALYYDDAGAASLMVGTAEGVWAVDTSAATARVLGGLDFRQQVNSENCKGMVATQGSLYVPLGSGYHRYVKYTWDGSAADRKIVGPGALDGVVTARQGAITAVAQADQWVFWASGGLVASKNASVFSWDVTNESLHSEWENATANRRIDAIAIANGVLHVSERTGNNTSVMRYHNNILDDPAQGASVAYESSARLIRPAFNFGFPGDKKAVLTIRYEADSLSAANTGEHINVDYDVDESGSYTDLGDILSGDKDLTFGSGAGVEASTVRIKENLARGGTNTNTPKGRSYELAALVRPDDLEAWTLTVDLRASADEMRDVEQVTADLEALRPPTKITCVSLEYGQVTGKQVIVDPLRWDEALVDGVDGIQYEPREGFVTVVLREVV